MRVDDQDVVRVAALGVCDDVVVVAVRVVDALEVQGDRRQRRRVRHGRLVLVVEVVAHGERRERHRDRRDARQASREHDRATRSVALVEDDHARRAGVLGVRHLLAERAGAPLDERDASRHEAGEIGRITAARRATGGRDLDAAGRLDLGGRRADAQPGIELRRESVVVRDR